jgi:hypothetical protein
MQRLQTVLSNLFWQDETLLTECREPFVFLALLKPGSAAACLSESRKR